MRNRILVVGIFMLFILMVANACHAGMINYKRRDKTLDAPKARTTGTVKSPKKPVALAPEMKKSPKATNWTERKYDKNRDGSLQSSEVKALLRDVANQVSKKGSYKINTNILKQYDRNKDGKISGPEARKITADLR